MSLSEPHIDHDKRPRTGSNCYLYQGIYLCIIHLAFVTHIRVHPDMIRVFQYINMRVWLSTQQELELLIVCRAMETGMRTDTWYKQIEPTETVKL